MKFDDLRAFVAFIDHGSVSGAARQLHLSQPALTRRIQRLELSVGGELLDRSAKPPRVSALGLQLGERARLVLRETQSLCDLARADAEPRGRFRVGAVPSISDRISVEAVKVLKQRFPQLHLEMRTDLSVELTKKVQAGELDSAAVMLAPGSSVPDEVQGTYIGTQRIFIVAGKRHAVGRAATVAELAKHSWVLFEEGSCVCRLALKRAMEANGHELHVAVSEHGLERQLALVSAGAGLGCVAEVALKTSRHRNALRRVRVKNLDLRFDIWVLQRQRPGPLTAPIGSFTEIVAKRFGSRARP